MSTQKPKMKPVSLDWCGQDALIVAKELLGKVIEYNGCSGMIVETEAYKRDPASHAYKITPRSEIMLKTHGRWYVYFVYGMYFCINLTTNKNDVGAVLIRAIEPLEGIEIMKKRRRQSNIKDLCSGPGKLCHALNITKSLNDTPITGPIKLFQYKTVPKGNIGISGRVGIKEGTDLPWRFFIKNNDFISRIK